MAYTCNTCGHGATVHNGSRGPCNGTVFDSVDAGKDFLDGLRRSTCDCQRYLSRGRAGHLRRLREALTLRGALAARDPS
jgi:hypothetical protein